VTSSNLIFVGAVTGATATTKPIHQHATENVRSAATSDDAFGRFSMSVRMNGAGRVGWLAAPLTRTWPSKIT
jgi:hypothetical protein